MTEISRTVRTVGASMRLTRLVVTDDVPGGWWIKAPLEARAARHHARHGTPPRWWRYTEGLDCPFCIGLWIAGAVTVADHLVGDRTWWRLLTAALTLNEAAAHLGSRLGDVSDSEDKS